mmetsp:Transcript_33879/g.85283  ORF Transcript_33879/g.85283 Transcript_33879/m.85283 type:complete len:319 (+) Transcript_33879:1123-2079(+)
MANGRGPEKALDNTEYVVPEAKASRSVCSVPASCANCPSNVPRKRLWPRYSRRIRVRVSPIFGNSPSRRLKLRSMVNRLDMLDIHDAGTVPVSWLSDRSRVCRSSRLANSAGRVPVSSFCDTSSSTSTVSAASAAGTAPVSRFDSSCSAASAGAQRAMHAPGMAPPRLLNDSEYVCSCEETPPTPRHASASRTSPAPGQGTVPVRLLRVALKDSRCCKSRTSSSTPPVSLLPSSDTSASFGKSAASPAGSAPRRPLCDSSSSTTLPSRSHRTPAMSSQLFSAHAGSQPPGSQSQYGMVSVSVETSFAYAKPVKLRGAW